MEQPIALLRQNITQVAVFGNGVYADKVHGIFLLRALFKQAVHIHLESNSRRELAVQRNRVHLAVPELHIGVLLRKLRKDRLMVSAKQIVQTSGEDEKHLGYLVKALKKVINAVYYHLLIVARNDIRLVDEKVRDLLLYAVHLAAQRRMTAAGKGTHKKMMALGNKRRNSYNAPAAVGGGNIMQCLLKTAAL